MGTPALPLARLPRLCGLPAAENVGHSKKNRPTTPLFGLGLPPGAFARRCLACTADSASSLREAATRGTGNPAATAKATAPDHGESRSRGCHGQATLVGFLSLQHMRTCGSTFSKTLPCGRDSDRGLASPASVQPQGLVTLSPLFSPQGRAGLVSCRRRSWDLPLRSFLLCRR